MPPRIPEETRLRIVALATAEKSQREIAREVGVRKATVNRIIQAFRDEGRIGDAPRCLNRKTTREQDMAIVAVAAADPFMTAGQIKDIVGLDTSDELVRKRLREAGLTNRCAAQKPLLSATSKAERLRFAHEHLQWTVDDWGQVAFTDESTFCTQWNQKQRVYRPALSRYTELSLCVIVNDAHGGPSTQFHVTVKCAKMLTAFATNELSSFVSPM